MPEHRYLYKCYKILYYLDSLGRQNWATDVKHILNNTEFGYIWEQQNIENEKLFFKEFEQTLKAQFLQKRHEEIEKES